MPAPELTPSIRSFISRYVRSVEQLEILVLLAQEPAVEWSAPKVYEAILSTPQSVERWLDEMVRAGLLEKIPEPMATYRRSKDESLVSQITTLAELYRTAPARVIEAIYRRGNDAAQSFADAFKIIPPDQTP